MTWFYLSLIQALFTAFMWLMLKHAQNRGASNEGSLFVYFIFLLLGIFAWHFLTSTPFIFPSFWWAIVLLLAGVIAAVSNLFVLSSFGRGPNPGFSLALSNTQSVLVTIVGVLFFKSHVTFLAAFGIAVVIAGVFLIHGRNSKDSLRDFKWIYAALFSAIAASIYWIFVTLVSREIPDLQVTVILTLVVVPQLCVYALARFSKLQFKKWASVPAISFLALTGIVGAVSNLSGIAAVISAPNPGYALAISTSSIILVTFFSYLFFKSSLGRWQVLGMFVIVLGVVLIKLGV